MIKVRILDRCEFCGREAYVFVREDVDARGEAYDHYRPCKMCNGSGYQAKWVNQEEFANLLERATSLNLTMLLLNRSSPLISIRIAEMPLGYGSRLKHHLEP